MAEFAEESEDGKVPISQGCSSFREYFAEE